MEEKRRMLLSSGGPTGSGGGRCRRFGNCHSFSTDSMRDFRYSKAFMGSFFKKGRCYPEAKVPDDLRRCYRDFFFSLAERAITAVPVTALLLEAIVTSSAMPRFHQAESNNKGRQNKQQPSKTNNATPTRHKPKTKHLSGN